MRPTMSPLGIAIVLTTGVLGCGNDHPAGGTYTHFDAGVFPDGRPAPYFREAGCGPSGSGVSGSGGNCGPSGYPIADAAPRPDVAPADTLPPDIQPDSCVPPAQWDCPVTLGFDKRGSETTAGVHGDFNGPSPLPWVTKDLVLSGNRWSIDLLLPQGRQLTYKFVVDKGLSGETWFEDPSNANKVSDGLGGFNSVRTVSCLDPCARAVP